MGPKLQRASFAGDYASAIEASSRAQRLLWTSPSMFETAEYHLGCTLPSGILRVSSGRPADVNRIGRPTTGSSSSGGRMPRRISRTAPRWSAPRSAESKAGIYDAERPLDSGHPLGPRQRLITMRRRQ